jgi:hypothetical protein
MAIFEPPLPGFQNVTWCQVAPAPVERQSVVSGTYAGVQFVVAILVPSLTTGGLGDVTSAGITPSEKLSMEPGRYTRQ